MITSQVSIEALKRRAKKIAREQGIIHAQALDAAAKEAGFQNFVHAKRAIAETARPKFELLLHHNWRNYETGKRGVASLSLGLSMPIEDLLKPHQFEGYLGGCWIDKTGELVIGYEQYVQDDEHYAMQRVKRVARALEFMQITGFRPSDARRCYPKGSWHNRPPLADHDHCWYDPESRSHILSTEPYPGRADSCLADQRAWEARFEFSARRIEWGSIYGFGTELWLVCNHAANAIVDRATKRLLRTPTNHSFEESKPSQ